MYHLIPEVYQLTTNDGIFLINSHPTLDQMAKYLVEKRKSGMEIKDIVFRVVPYKVPSFREVRNLH